MEITWNSAWTCRWCLWVSSWQFKGLSRGIPLKLNWETHHLTHYTRRLRMRLLHVITKLIMGEVNYWNRVTEKGQNLPGESPWRKEWIPWWRAFVKLTNRLLDVPRGHDIDASIDREGKNGVWVSDIVCCKWRVAIAYDQRRLIVLLYEELAMVP